MLNYIWNSELELLTENIKFINSYYEFSKNMKNVNFFQKNHYIVNFELWIFDIEIWIENFSL